MSLRVPILGALLAWSACGEITPRVNTHDDLPTSPVEVEACARGGACAPFRVSGLPSAQLGDTTALHEGIDAYGCAPDIDMAGPEAWYQITLQTPGLLTASLQSEPGHAVHLLEGFDPHDCLARDDASLTAYLEPGVYFIVVDTALDEHGDPLAGPFELDLSFVDLGAGPCAVTPTDLRMWWPDCAWGIDCYEAPDDEGEVRVWLRTPAFGPVAKEAHLVTTEDHARLGGAWPTGSTQEIAGHYYRSEAASGYPLRRREPWAPSPLPGDVYARGATGQPVPVLDEVWYVNMYWRDRPEPGTRMLVYSPETGRAVVASGGYETGPGSNRSIGGASEEIHDWLGSHHKRPLVIAFLADQDLPLGPIDCED